ncbi:MAG: MBL fold metallo-hydrolase [Planctomycetota bacterium]
MPTLRVISIGALAAHPLWNERDAARTGHATTTLIESTEPGSDAPVRLLVDPGLPGPALLARLRERANLGPEQITHVFLTGFEPERRRAIAAFDRARWLISGAEREAVGVPLAQGLKRLAENFESPDEEVEAILRSDVAVLQRCEAAPDTLAEGVDLFPLPGVSAGCCGLLLSGRETTLVCGDAIPTIEHLEQGKVLPSADDAERAQESFREAVEIADVLVLGRDNLVVNPLRKMF